MKGVYFANAPSAFEKLLSTIKSFLNEKNKNRVSLFYNKDKNNVITLRSIKSLLYIFTDICV